MDKINIVSEAPLNRCTPPGAPFRLRAFSLVELLVVIAILGILAVMVVPGLTSILRGSNLSRGGQMVADQFALARQEAVSKNCDIEVRFYELTNDVTSGWRGVQLSRIDRTPTGPVTNAASRLSVLPDGIVMTEAGGLSPLITAGSGGTATLPGYGPAKYKQFRFRANGSLDSSDDTNNYITLINATDQETPPANYYTLQINPLTGKADVFRP